MKEFLKEEIKIIADKVSFLRNMLLAITSGIVGIIFGFSQNKIIVNSLIIGLFFVGVIAVFLIFFRINFLEQKRDELILKLKDIKWVKF